MSLAGLFSALADPTRCRVVELLCEKPQPVHALAAAFAISRPAISRHLRVLKDAGLVQEVKAGRENVYSLRRSTLKPVRNWLDKHGAGTASRRTAAVATPATALTLVRPASRLPRAVVPATPPAPQLSFFDL